jgi:membrane-bound lytic murein transglycosylase D
MKMLLILALPVVIALAGCASTVAPQAPVIAPGTETSAGTPAATAAAAQPKPHVAIIPSGPLQPLAASEASAASAVAPLAPPADLWSRIRSGFAMPDLNGDLVRDREQWYATRPDYIQRMTERSSKYLFHIVEELERRGMPSELALLPFIESAFNPQAVSSAKAAGMWQFMPATGSYFELKQNAFRDDRRDVLASTRAALDYLQKLHGMFGDWHLALAAYNWGEGSVGRAIARNQKLGLGTSYTDLNMPAETRQYVPKLQAVKNIVANPQNFRTELPFIGNHPYFQTVDITRDIDVALAAKLADVKLEDFKALNPSAHRPVILAAGTSQILLPWDNATVFQRNFEAHNQGQYSSWTVWTVPTTMTAAEAAKRSGMNEADLRAVNNIPPRMLIKTGSALLVPRSGKTTTDVAEQVADNGQLSLAPEAVNRRTTVKAGKHDTVASIAKRYRLSPASVADWNDVKVGSAFRAGQQVVVFLPVRAASAGARSGTSAKSRSPVRATAKKRGGTPVKAKRR